MQSIMGILNLVESGDAMKELTEIRSLAAVPIGGRYRLVDFVLSSMVNAGIRNVGIFVQDQYRSLMDHLGTGKEWDLDRHRDGLFILPPEWRGESRSHAGDLEILHRHLDYLDRCRQELVVMSGASMVCNIDFNEVLRFHNTEQADITVVYQPEAPGSDLSKCTTLEVAENYRITDMEVNASRPLSRHVSMKMFVLNRTLLMELIDQAVSRGETDFVKDVLIKNLRRLRICGYPFTGYVARITSLQSYYKTSMAFLDPSVWRQLFFGSGPIFTKIKNEAPAHYCEDAEVTNCLVANGCVIQGRVENSVLFRGVKVNKGAYIKDSILMQKSEVGAHCHLENVVLDKDVVITKQKRLVGDVTYPMVISKKAVV